MCDRLRVRRGFAAAWAPLLSLLLVMLIPVAGTANQDGGGNERNEQRDTQSRNEEELRLDQIPVRFGDGRFEVRYIILIQTRYIHVTDTFSEGLGVDFENLNRADVSDIPLLGSLFDKPLSAEDFTETNRVGAAYRGADGTLAVVLDDGVDVADSTVSVVNGEGRYTVSMAPMLAQGNLPDLGEFGTLSSVQTLVNGTATRETSIVLGGLTNSSTPAVSSGAPVLKDVPVVGHLLMGPVHEVEKDELVILIKPTVIIREEEG